MNWMHHTALGIGIAFGLLFLILGISEGFGGIPSPIECVLLLFGPITMIAATAVAWRHERIGGWWLIAGGIITAILFTIDLVDKPTNLLRTLLIIPLPMLVAGSLWVRHIAKLS